MNLRHLVCRALASLGLAFPASALSDLWVDPVTGSDAVVGTSASAPLRTIGEATSRARAQDSIHLLPGTYSEATGESFPIQVPAHVTVESVGGRGVTAIDARATAGYESVILILQGQSVLAGVTVLRDEHTHLSFWSSSSSTVRPLARDCEFVGGRTVTGSSFGFEGCTMRDQTAASLELTGIFGAYRVSLTDCDLVGSVHGVDLYNITEMSIEIDRCRFLDHSSAAIQLASVDYNDKSVSIRDSLIARCGRGTWIDLRGSQLNKVYIARCTIVENAQDGLRVHGHDPAHSIVHSSVLAYNGTDAWTSSSHAQIPTSHCISSDGTLTSGDNNIIGDPRFVASHLDDWSLRADSPCLDRGLATSGIPPIDIDKTPRMVDGDLNLVAAPDMGAFEHAPLRGPEVIEASQPALFGLSGPAGGFSTLIIAPGGYAPFGSTTPFGRLFLQSRGAFRITPVITTGGAPTWIDVASHLDPSWVGTTIGFQALPRSFAAPAGGAFSNPLLIPIE